MTTEDKSNDAIYFYYVMCVFVYAYRDLLDKHMGNNMVLGIMNTNLTYKPNSKKSWKHFHLYKYNLQIQTQNKIWLLKIFHGI